MQYVMVEVGVGRFSDRHNLGTSSKIWKRPLTPDTEKRQASNLGALFEAMLLADTFVATPCFEGIAAQRQNFARKARRRHHQRTHTSDTPSRIQFLNRSLSQMDRLCLHDQTAQRK